MGKVSSHKDNCHLSSVATVLEYQRQLKQRPTGSETTVKNLKSYSSSYSKIVCKAMAVSNLELATIYSMGEITGAYTFVIKCPKYFFQYSALA